MKQRHSTKKGPGRVHRTPTLNETRRDKLNDDLDKKLTASQKFAKKYERRYRSATQATPSQVAKGFKGWRNNYAAR